MGNVVSFLAYKEQRTGRALLFPPNTIEETLKEMDVMSISQLLNKVLLFRKYYSKGGLSSRNEYVYGIHLLDCVIKKTTEPAIKEPAYTMYKYLKYQIENMDKPGPTSA